MIFYEKEKKIWKKETKYAIVYENRTIKKNDICGQLAAQWMPWKISSRFSKFITNHIAGNNFGNFMRTILLRKESNSISQKQKQCHACKLVQNEKFTSWTACPQRARTCNWNFPCICPTVSERSSPSMLANKSNFGTGRSKNFELKFSNHPDQYCSDFERLIRQVYFFSLDFNRLFCSSCDGASGVGTLSSSASSAIVEWLNTEVEIVEWLESVSICSSGRGNSFVANFPVSMLNTIQIVEFNSCVFIKQNRCFSYFIIWPGIETFAEAAFRICPLRMLHSIACWILLKFCGRDRRKLCMLASASIAVPSTTSITTQPINDGIKSMAAMCTQIAPPMECPTIIIGGAVSGYNFEIIAPTSLKTNKPTNVSKIESVHRKNNWNYLASVVADRSDSFVTYESPWPLKSMAKHWQSTIAVISVCEMRIRLICGCFDIKLEQISCLPRNVPKLMLNNHRRAAKAITASYSLCPVYRNIHEIYHLQWWHLLFL